MNRMFVKSHRKSVSIILLRGSSPGPGVNPFKLKWVVLENLNKLKCVEKGVLQSHTVSLSIKESQNTRLHYVCAPESCFQTLHGTQKSFFTDEKDKRIHANHGVELLCNKNMQGKENP